MFSAIEKVKQSGFEKFISKLMTPACLQEAFQSMQNDYYKAKQQFIEQDNNLTLFKQNHEKWSKELEERECEALGLHKAIEVMKVKTVRKLYEKKLYSVEQRVEALKKVLDKYDPLSFARLFLNKQRANFNIEFIEWLSQRAGEWFETGALGEGSVSFNGKTYRHKKEKVVL